MATAASAYDLDAPAISERWQMLVRLCWTGEAVRIGAMLAAGLAVWLLYSVVQVLVNGIVFDEVVVPAQIITGAVKYPDGHPHGLYFPRLFNLQNYLAAVQWSLVPNTALMSAMGNVLFVLAATFVPFAATVVLTRRPWWGHVASVLMLTETTTRFNGSYLMWMFPHFSTHGHLGLHFALLVPILLGAGLWRSGGLFLGLLPAIHLTMTVVVWPWAALYLWWSRGRLRGRVGRQLAAAVSVGLVICAALAAVILWRTEIRLAPPYDAPADIEQIYRSFTSTTDGHRQPFRMASFAYMVNPVAFLVLGALLIRSWGKRFQDATGAGPSILWILSFGVMLWTYVYGTRLFQAATGWLPEAVQMTMPSRLSNISATLLMPMTVAVVAAAWDRLNDRARTIVLALAADVVLAAGALTAYDNYLAFSHVMYVALGLAVAVDFHAHAQDEDASSRLALNVLAFVTFTATFVFMYFAIGTLIVLPFVASAVACAAILAIGAKVQWRGGPIWRHGVMATLVAGVVITAGLATRAEHIPNNWDATEGRWYQESTFDRSLNQWLAGNARPNEMLLVALWPRSAFQVVTGHPVLIDIDTLMMVAYIKNLAPAVNVLARDVFGIDYADGAQLERIVDEDGMLRPTSAVWLEAWRARSQQQWQLLAERYAFRLVLAPKAVTLNLPAVLQGPVWTLYTIPVETHRAGEATDVKGI